MHKFVSYTMIILVLIVVATVEIMTKTAMLLLALPFYFLGVLFAPWTARVRCPRWLDKTIDWVSSRKLTWAKKAARAYYKALL